MMILTDIQINFDTVHKSLKNKSHRREMPGAFAWSVNGYKSISMKKVFSFKFQTNINRSDNNSE